MTHEVKVPLSLRGKNVEVEFCLEDYQEAEDSKLSLSQHINRKYATDRNDPGLAFDQIAAHCGLILSEDHNYGYRSPTVSDIISGKAQMGGIVAPDGESRRSPAGALFFPAMVIDTLEATLRDNHGTYISTFLSMVAATRSITTPKYDKVIIDVSRPRDTRPGQIAQLAEPAKMLSITTSDTTRSIPTYAIGMEISAEASRAASIDLVQMALRVHGEEERARRVDEDFLGIVNGDSDAGEAGIIGSAITAQSLDATIVSAGGLTQKAWVKYIMQLWKRRRISHVVCNIDTYLAIEGRTGRPVKNDEPAVDERLNTLPEIALPMIPQRVGVFIMDDMAANTVVGLDASKAMVRVVHVAAEYSAIQEFVMRRSTAFRVDTAERFESFGYSEAFAPMTLTV